MNIRYFKKANEETGGFDGALKPSDFANSKQAMLQYTR